MVPARAVSKSARPPSEGPEPGSVLQRAFSILELVAASGRALTVLEISEIQNIPKPTVHRLCAKLADQGYLAREPTGRHFRGGPKLVAMSFNALRHDGTRDERHAILEALVAELGETCNFTMRAGNAVLYLDRVEARWPLRLQLDPGSRVPLHCTASGKLFLASLSPERLERILAVLKLAPHTPHTITTRAALEEELSRIAVRGYSLDSQEFLLGLIAIAVPIKDAADRTVAAVACHAPSARLSLDQALAYLPQLRAAATRLSATLPFL